MLVYRRPDKRVETSSIGLSRHRGSCAQTALFDVMLNHEATVAAAGVASRIPHAAMKEGPKAVGQRCSGGDDAVRTNPTRSQGCRRLPSAARQRRRQTHSDVSARFFGVVT